ncbi:tetratricopeptide repeat protein [Candidatus Poribacteria bacterium]
MKGTVFLILAIIWVTASLADATDNDTLADQHFAEAVKLLGQADHEAAIAEYEKVIELAPESEIAQDAQYWIGQSYFRMGRYDKALSVFEEIVQAYPESAIVPVTQLMVTRVQQEKKNGKPKKRNIESDSGTIIDPETGIKYTRIKVLAGENDVITYTTGGIDISPNEKFLIWEKRVVPVDGGATFDLVDMPANRGSWSPDGRKICFYSDEAIWVIPVSPDTGKAVGTAKKLLDGEYRYQMPVSWSPDSETITFERRDKEEVGYIYTLSTKDNTLTQITHDPVYEGHPIWSPDGEKIAYNRGNEIRIIPAEGGEPREIVDRGRPASWSSDSNWLAYNYPLTLVHVTRMSKIVVRQPGAIGSFLSWSSEGAKLLFYRPSYDSKSVLKVVSASGGPSFELGDSLSIGAWEQSWSPDGKMVIVKGKDSDGKSVFWEIPLAGGDALPLRLDVSVDVEPWLMSLSPDCKKAFFAANADGDAKDLWVVPVSLEDGRTTGPAVKIFSAWDAKTAYNITFSWSPDGTKIALIHGYDVWIASTEGDDPVQVETEEGEFTPVWSPDGRMIAHRVYYSENEKALRVLSVSDGKITKILETPRQPDRRIEYTWSPDSREVAIHSKGVISVISVADGSSRLIADPERLGIADFWGIQWSPDGKNLAFLTDQSEEICVIPVKGGEITRLAADDSGEKYFLYWSPDGKWLSYNSDQAIKTRPEGAIWEADLSELLSGEESGR